MDFLDVMYEFILCEGRESSMNRVIFDGNLKIGYKILYAEFFSYFYFMYVTLDSYGKNVGII